MKPDPIEVLRQYEFCIRTGGANRCPACFAKQQNGHNAGCSWAACLALPQSEEPPVPKLSAVAAAREDAKQSLSVLRETINLRAERRASPPVPASGHLYDDSVALALAVNDCFEGEPILNDLDGTEVILRLKAKGWSVVPASADRVRVTDNGLLTEAAARIVDIWMGGDTAWRSRIDDSEFLESADWIAAVRLATAALSATPEQGRVEELERENARLKEVISLFDRAIDEAEAILGGEYGEYFGPFFDLVWAARWRLAPRATTDNDGGADV